MNKKRTIYMMRSLITNGGGEEIWTPDTAGMNRML